MAGKLRIDDKDLEKEVRNINPIATISLAAGAANVMEITIQLSVAERRKVEFYMSTDANGAGLTGSAYSGDFAATDGFIIAAHTAKKHLVCMSDATGKVVLTLTDTVKPANERVCVINTDGSLTVSAASGTNWGA